jgi:hypothetical protein
LAAPDGIVRAGGGQDCSDRNANRLFTLHPACVLAQASILQERAGWNSARIFAAPTFPRCRAAARTG